MSHLGDQTFVFFHRPFEKEKKEKKVCDFSKSSVVQLNSCALSLETPTCLLQQQIPGAEGLASAFASPMWFGNVSSGLNS